MSETGLRWVQCKGMSGECIVPAPHLGACRRSAPGSNLDGSTPPPLGHPTEILKQVSRNHDVTTVCNQCVTRDEEITRLRNQIADLIHNGSTTPIQLGNKPKRDRAAYMRKYRRAHG